MTISQKNKFYIITKFFENFNYRNERNCFKKWLLNFHLYDIIILATNYEITCIKRKRPDLVLGVLNQGFSFFYREKLKRPVLA